MATLDNKSIRGALKGAVRYVNNPDKNLPPDGIQQAAAYIRGGHSVERLYSRGHNGCSSNPDIAIQQFYACEQLYRQKKGGAREAGLASGKQPIIAEHFFLSFPTNENVSYQTQCEIVDELCASDLLRDFYAMSNRHWNTDNDHSHILVCNISKSGDKKLGINNTKRNILRKELDRICVKHGLSIIDDPALRYGDPEREAFVRAAVDKVHVYAPADYKKIYNPCREYDKWMLDQIAAGKVEVAEGVSKNRHCTQSKAYERWIAEHPAFIRSKDKKAAKSSAVAFVNPEDEKAARAYYWDERFKRNGYYYAVRLYDEDGNRKPMLLLMIELLYLVVTHEEMVFLSEHPKTLPLGVHEKVNWGVNWKLQNSYDAMRYQEEHGVRTPWELTERIADVGKSLSEARQGLTYYNNAITNGDDLYAAILAFNSADAPPDIKREAYRIMSAHKCNTPVEVGKFLRRRAFAEGKVKNLEMRVQDLKDTYKELKFIEKHNDTMLATIEQYVWENAGKHSLDDLIDRAKANQGQQKASKTNEKIF